MITTFIKNTALSRVEYWYTLAVLGGVYAIGMTINTVIADNSNYNWGTIAGFLAISVYLMTLYAKPSTNSLLTSIVITFGTILVVALGFSGGDDIPGLVTTPPTTKQLCEIVFVGFGIVYPILMTLLTLLNPTLKKKEDSKKQ